MQTNILFQRKTLILILFLQFIPLIMFPPSSFTPSSQEYWLPILLSVFSLIAVIQLLRGNESNWPWDLIGFAQGFNIISRLMLIMPHSTIIENGVVSFNWPYFLITVVSMLLSAFVLWYIAKAEVRTILLQNKVASA